MGAYFHVKNSKGSWMTYCQTDYTQTDFDPQSDSFKFDSHTKECIFYYDILYTQPVLLIVFFHNYLAYRVYRNSH